MKRLQAEWQRLYLSAPATGEAPESEPPTLALQEGRTRSLVLAVAAPGPWAGVLAVWQGVQAELQLPAPAIAVAGGEGYQLWFALAGAVPVPQALGFLAGLRSRYLAELGPECIASFPPEPVTARAARPPRLPPHAIGPGRWSAFVASDLGALFAEEPWLDLPPSADAQADLLSRMQVTPLADWRRACERLAPTAASPPSLPAASDPPVRNPAGPDDDPRRFLLGIMNDPAVDLHLRIEAAKALLPACAGPRAG